MKINNLNKSKEGLYLPLMEAFHTIQGEGFFSGKPAFFLRIGGCDVGCQWCDVKESWDPSKHKLTSVQSIVDEIKKYNTDTVVITGGEPLMWDLSYLTKSLKTLSYQIHLETSGTYPLSGDFDWICLSPKKNKPTFLEQKLNRGHYYNIFFQLVLGRHRIYVRGDLRIFYNDTLF